MPKDPTLTLHRSLTAFSRTTAADTSSSYALLRSNKRDNAERITMIDQQPFLAQRLAQDVLQRLAEKPVKIPKRKPRNREPRAKWTITESKKLPPQRPYKIR